MPDLPVETWLFATLILAGVLVAHVKFTDKSAHDAPGILITIGIFATFYGIAHGLYRFDIQNVEASLPVLINGIKIAFWASVIGVGAALTLKIRAALFGVANQTDVPSEGATIDDMIVHLSNSSKALDRLQQAMVGDEDSTLLTQLKLVRSDQNDRLDGLRKAFAEFAEKQAENNSKALIEALKEVIRDFNTKINEQFGDNFKHLNHAVGKINEWQELYRQQMTDMIAQQHLSAADMKVAGAAFSTLVENSSSFDTTAKSLRSTIGIFSEIEIVLRSNMKEFSTLVEATRSGIPTIEKKVLEIVSDVGGGAKAAAEMISTQVRASASEMAVAIAEQNDIINGNIANLGVNLKSHVSDFVVQVGATSRLMGDSIERQQGEVNRHLTAANAHATSQMSDLSSNLAIALNRHNEAIGNNVVAVGASLQKHSSDMTSQVTTSAKSMGEAVVKQVFEVTKGLAGSNAEMQRQMTTASTELLKVIQKHNEMIGNNLNEMSNKTQQQVLALDAELASALKKSLDSLGQQLGALSSKFVQDYGPLTDRLREVVQLSRRLES